MYLNLSVGLALDLLGAVKSKAAEYKALETGEHGHVYESRRRSLEVIRHRLEWGLGIENPYGNPENLAHVEAMKKRRRPCT